MRWILESFILLFVAPTMAIAQPSWINDGLVLFENFDKPFGNFALVQGPTEKLGTAGYLDNSGHIFNARVNSRSYTVSYWFMGRPQSSIHPIILQTRPWDCGDYVAAHYYGYDGEGNSLQIVTGLACSENRLEISNKLEHNKYFLITIVYEGNVIKSYLNGILLNEAQISPTDNPQQEVTEIAMGGPEEGREISGAYDNLRVYDRALSSEEISQLYDYETAPTVPQPISEWLVNDLIAYYPLDGNVLDISGNGYHGVSNSSSFAVDRFGLPDGAFNLIPENPSGISINDNIVPSGYDPMTLSFWVQLQEPKLPTNGFTKYPLFSVNQGLEHWNFNLIFQANGVDFTPNVERFDSTGFLGSYSRRSVFESLSDALNWHHFVLSFAGDSLVRLYLDGNPVPWEFSPNSITSFRNTGNFQIGIAPGAPGGATFSGSIDDFRVYRRSLNSAEVLHLYEYESQPPANIPTYMATRLESLVDRDGDGVGDIFERDNGSDPDNPLSVPFTSPNMHSYPIPENALDLKVEFYFADFRSVNNFSVVNHDTKYFQIYLENSNPNPNERFLDIIRTSDGTDLVTDGKLDSLDTSRELKHSKGIFKVTSIIIKDRFTTFIDDEEAFSGKIADFRLNKYGYAEPTRVTFNLLEPSFLVSPPIISVLSYSTDDTDHDSVPDYLEGFYGTDYQNFDTDGDGLSDGTELSLFNGYRSLKRDYSWEEANSEAIDRGGHLATINNELESQIIIKFLEERQSRSSDEYYNTWLGGTDSVVEGNWQWITNEPFYYSQWSPGEPNNDDSTSIQGEDYLFLMGSDYGNGLWSDSANMGWDKGSITHLLVEFGYASDPTKPDTDDDGYSDLQEREWNTNPNIPTFELQVSPQNGGTVQSPKNHFFYDRDEPAILTANPDAGYAFERWSGSLDSFENPLEVTVSEPLVLIPIFKEAIPPTIDSTPYIGSLNEGQSQTFQISYTGTAPFTFQWFNDGSEIDNSTSTLTLSNVTAEHAGVYTFRITNEYGNASLDAVTLSVISPIRILSQSGVVKITEGQPLNLVFAFSGTEPVSIQWFKDEVVLDNVDSNVLLKEGAEISDSGVYSFTVSNELGTAESNPIPVTVNEYIAPPFVTQFMVSPNPALVGSSLALTTAVSGDGPFTFNWYRDSVLLATTDLPLYSIESVTDEDSGEYTVTVSNRVDKDKSSPVSVSVVTPVSITDLPVDTLIMEKSPLELSVTVTGGGQITYTWYRNNKKIDGATSSTYRVPSATFSDTGDYHVVVSNGASTVKSATASVLVTPFIEPPSILIQPKSKRVNLGDPSSLVVSATGAEPLKYQWYLNGNAITGAIKNFILFDSFKVVDTGIYTVTVTNDAGSVTSEPASLSPILPLEIIKLPNDVSVLQGEGFILEVELVSSEDVTESYWAKDGNRIPDSSGLKFEVQNASLENAGNYTFHATDGKVWLQSIPIVVEVNQPPVFTMIPEDITASSGQTVMLQWVADGTGTLKYDLLLNNEVLDSNDTGTFRVKVPELDGDYEFVAKVSNSYGSSTSGPVIVSVQVSSPIIIDQSTSITMVQGEPLELNINAIGGGLSYQWYKGAAKIPDANSPVFIINETGEGDAGTYFVVISNSKGIVTSNPIKVSFGVNVSVQADGANIILRMNPGDKVASWKLQKSYDLLFWEDVQNLEESDLNQLIRPIEEDVMFYRVVER
jgi:hypothetical protein